MAYTDDRWTDAQDQLLRDNYLKHGGRWDGWATLLPNRTGRAIDARARRIGLVRQRPKPKGKPRPKRPPAADERHRDKEIALEPDPHEGYVMACMAAGMTPSEIDKRMHWYNGTTRLILTNRWERENEQHEGTDD